MSHVAHPCRSNHALLLLSALCAILMAFIRPADGHGNLHELIAAKTVQIEEDSSNGALYLQRGELHRQHGDWDSALADYERAAALDPGLTEVEFARGRMLFEAGWSRSAEVVLTAFVVRNPRHAKAHETLGLVLDRRGEHLKSADEFGRAIETTERFVPELYAARANALAAVGEDRIKDAIEVLDAGMKMAGCPIVSLQLLGIDLEVRQGHYDAALSRLQTLADQSERKEQWHVRRAEILRKAHRDDQARAAYREALKAIDQLAPARRQTEFVVELEKRARAGLQDLEASPGAQARQQRDTGQATAQEPTR